jgi:hypothetical protein
MMARRFITSLLVVLLATSGTTRALAASRDEDLATTPEEEREARELVGEFNQKFGETNDISPLIKEYFVTDFASRLRQHAETFPFVLIEWQDESAPPDPNDLLRFYVASTNCLRMSLPLYAAALQKVNKDRVEGADKKEPKLEEAVPPAALEIIKDDPLLRQIWSDSEDETAQESAGSNAAAARTDDSAKDEEQKSKEQKGAEQEGKIDNAEKLRRITLTLESLSKILREHLAAHPFSFEKKAKDESSEAEEEEDDDDETLDPDKIEIFKHARVLSKEFYGYPEGTRIVCANAGLLHVEMVRVDGKLRILTVYLLMED